MHLGRIFISYRREDTAGYARVLYDRLSARFPGGIFMDVSNIGPGDDFAQVIQNAVGESRVVIALIGKQWQSVTAEGGHRRLDDPNDFVRLEIATALNRGLLVIPTLVPGANLPRADEIPESLAGLFRRQAIQLTEADFDQDVRRLIAVIEQELGLPRTQKVRRRIALAAAVVLVAALALAFLLWWPPHARVATNPTASAENLPVPPPAENAPATRSAETASAPRSAGNALAAHSSENAPAPHSVPMTIHGMFANGGWMLYFDVPEKHIREISYRMDAGAAFTSTGESSTQTDSLTGLPVPSSTITVPGLRGPHIIEVKYTDSQGQSHGPFSIPFDPQTEVIKQTKDILRLIGSWVSFREFSGKMLVYFTPVVSYKNAFRDIVYSVDNESVSQHLKFKPDWSGIGAPGLGPDDQTYLEIPMSTKYVAVKLIYADGTESAVRRFNIAQSEVER